MGPLAILFVAISAFAVSCLALRRVHGRRREPRAAIALAGVATLPLAIVVGFFTTPDRNPRGGPPVACRIAPVPSWTDPLGNAFATVPPSCRATRIPSHIAVLRRNAVTFPGGPSLPLVGGAVRSFVDGLTLLDGLPRITGWAVDAGSARPIDAILVFSDGSFIGALRTTVPRPDVTGERSKSGDEVVGYSVELPAEAATGTLVLVGVTRRSASVLPLRCPTGRHGFACRDG